MWELLLGLMSGLAVLSLLGLGIPGRLKVAVESIWSNFLVMPLYTRPPLVTLCALLDDADKVAPPRGL